MAKVTAWDLVSANDKLVGRVRFDDGAFGDFRPVADIARIDTGHADVMEIEVKDEEGNVATVRQELRGKPDPTIAAAGSMPMSRRGLRSTPSSCIDGWTDGSSCGQR